MAATLSISSARGLEARSSVLRRRNELAESHLELVPPIARQILASLPPSFELDDLISVGYVGLLKAATNYDPARHNDTPFSAYARPVVRGAILDSVRRGKYVENTRAPLVEMPESGASPEYEARLDQSRRGESVRRAIDGLGERHKIVVELYYGSAEMRLPAVGERLGVSKSRASQLRREAVSQLRGELVGV